MGDCICVRRGDGPEGCGICNETGTTPDIAGLCERQLVTITHKLPEVAFLAEAARYFETRPTGGGEDAAHWSNVFNANAKNCRQAADTLERQAAEIERLRSAGAALLAVIDETDSYQKRPGNGDWGVECACCMGELFDGTDRIRINIARAALTGEDT
jgi:hypothetical protein